MSFNGTVEWVLTHADEACTLLHTQAAELHELRILLAKLLHARQAAAAKRPWWKVWA